ncbi:MAG: hypothetical protein Q7T75_03245, partial [Mesorhizobium sp.]|nr:hypothetical protein [Mesorhizobium sp.]
MAETMHQASPGGGAIIERARAVAGAGGVDGAIASGLIPEAIDCTVSEALVLGLLKQGVRKFLSVFGHGSTDIAEVLRIYAGAGALSVHA